MDCPTCETLVDAYVDGELSAAESADFERALGRCPECRRKLEAARAMSGMLRELPATPAPDLLRARVNRELGAVAGAARPAMPRERMRWSAIAASIVVAASLGWLGGNLTGQGGHETDELVAGYIRVAMSDRAVDVVSSDRHTVKPWFAGRIDYSPPVHDLKSDGFPLDGGRVDFVDGRKVAVLVYQHGQHKLALTLWPSASASSASAQVAQRDGFSIAEWRRKGFELRAVSDVTSDEMASFAKALDRALDSDS